MGYHIDIIERWGKLIDQRGREDDAQFAGSVSASQNKSNAQVTAIRTVATCVDSKVRIEETLQRIKAYKSALRR